MRIEDLGFHSAVDTIEKPVAASGSPKKNVATSGSSNRQNTLQEGCPYFTLIKLTEKDRVKPPTSMKQPP